MAKQLVLRWTQERSWRVDLPEGDVGTVEEARAISRAMETAVITSGIFTGGTPDPASIRFEVTYV